MSEPTTVREQIDRLVHVYTNALDTEDLNRQFLLEGLLTELRWLSSSLKKLER